MTRICAHGHVLDEGRELCSRCNGPAVSQDVDALVPEASEEEVEAVEETEVKDEEDEVQEEPEKKAKKVSKKKK